nr:hypothetical protein [Tanacetum cinerariifolium]GEY91278.1 hypothetical protein [Tanacetum cinerariifolium]
MMGDAEINTLTMEQYLELTHRNKAMGVVKHKIRGNIYFEIKSQFMRELREDTFLRSKNDYAHEHVERVLDIVSLLNIPGVTHDTVMMYCPPSIMARQFKESITSSKKEMRLCTMLGKDFPQVRYGNQKIDDTTRERRYYEWVAQNYNLIEEALHRHNKLKWMITTLMLLKKSVGSTQNLMSRTSSYFPDFTQEFKEEPRPRDFPYQTLVSRRIIDPSHQEDPVLSIKSYFPTSSSVNKDKPQTRNYSFEEWLKVKIGHTHVDKSVKNVVLNEWILDSVDSNNA